METKTILVTGIGGNVGQGIVKNIRSAPYANKVVGTNITDFSAGNHLVDAFYKVPFGYDNEFIPAIKKIVDKEKVDLIIPSTDYESYYLAANKDEFSCKVSGSSKDVSEVYLDKYLTFLNHSENNIPFAQSCLPSAYSGQFKYAIAKPRKGRGSKGLIFNVFSGEGLSDDEYMIQDFHSGIEVTTAVYRSYITKEILGLISMQRTLENGATTYCKVIDDYDSIIYDIANSMCNQHPGLLGSFNIQSIVNANGDAIPFEVNCRISGTNSIRSAFGFKDVQYTIEELLFGEAAQKPEITKGEAYRFLSDVIYPYSIGLKGNNSDNFKLF